MKWTLPVLGTGFCAGMIFALVVMSIVGYNDLPDSPEPVDTVVVIDTIDYTEAIGGWLKIRRQLGIVGPGAGWSVTVLGDTWAKEVFPDSVTADKVAKHLIDAMGTNEKVVLSLETFLGSTYNHVRLSPDSAFWLSILPDCADSIAALNEALDSCLSDQLKHGDVTVSIEGDYLLAADPVEFGRDTVQYFYRSSDAISWEPHSVRVYSFCNRADSIIDSLTQHIEDDSVYATKISPPVATFPDPCADSIDSVPESWFPRVVPNPCAGMVSIAVVKDEIDSLTLPLRTITTYWRDAGREQRLAGTTVVWRAGWRTDTTYQCGSFTAFVVKLQQLIKERGQ